MLLLLPKLRVVSVISWSSCRSATHPPANAILRFALSSTSYRRNRSCLFQWYVIFAFSLYVCTRRR
ncbi:hypothetical protein CRE08_18235 [Escherichia coli]|nr:hypothetical protein CRE03_13730 [Escherichia coli]RFQ92224.1 hypothetical protein CRE08_18235 [Escherichia coli]